MPPELCREATHIAIATRSSLPPSYAPQSALVFLMTPGLAFFYSGMVAEGTVVTALMLNFGTIGIITLLWGVVG